MATITLTIPNVVATRVQDALCTQQNGYTGFEADGTTVQTKAAFVKNFIIRKIKEEVKSYEINAAQINAANAAEADVNNNLIIT